MTEPWSFKAQGLEDLGAQYPEMVALAHHHARHLRRYERAYNTMM